MPIILSSELWSAFSPGVTWHIIMAPKPDTAKDEDPLVQSPILAPLKVLTVGDGDLTLSLALSRAYGGSNSSSLDANNSNQQQLDLTATTLCSSYEELCDTYSNSAMVVQELVEERKATVLYGVDATQLATSVHQLHHKQFDLVLFHHPHLGLMTSNKSTDEAHHAQRHFVLLAHYLASAKSLLSSTASLSSDSDDCDGFATNVAKECVIDGDSDKKKALSKRQH